MFYSIPLYIAPYGISNPFHFTVPRALCCDPSLEERLSDLISKLEEERPPPPMAFVGKLLVPLPIRWVLLDLERGAIVHPSSASAFLMKSCLKKGIRDGCIVLPAIATLTTPYDASSDPLLTILGPILPSLSETPKKIWKDYLEKGIPGHDPADSIDGSQGGSVHRQGAYLESSLWPEEWPADSQCPGNNWGTTTYYHLSLWIPGASFPWDVFVEENNSPYEKISSLLESVLDGWGNAGGGQLVAESGYYPTGNRWMLVDFTSSPPFFVHSTDVRYRSYGTGWTLTYMVLPVRHGGLVPELKEALETEGALGWKKYWQDKLFPKK